jgi:hypothetical protein
MFLIRILLISLIGYLLIRSFMRFGEEEKHLSNRPETERKDNISGKKISKGIGEVIDYEEVENKN